MEKQFIEGIYLARKNNEKTPWIKATLAVDVHQFTQFANAHKNRAGVINIDLKESKAGKLYLELNTWQPKTAEAPADETVVIDEQIAPQDDTIQPEDLEF